MNDEGDEGNDTFFSVVNCTHESALDGLLIATPPFQALIFTFYSVVYVAAILGNGLVLVAVQASPRMRTVTNLLLANLAAGDLLMAVACVPFSFVPNLVLQYWPFGAPLCKIVSYSQAVSVLVSAYTLLAISVERYSAIMRPLRPRLARRHAQLVILAVWVAALATAAPILILSKLEQPGPRHKVCDQYTCTERWSSDEAQWHYTLALLALQYALPLSVLIFTHSRIAMEVWGRRVPGEAHNTRDRRMARNKRKMVKMMVVVVLVFTICWAPLNLLLLSLEMQPDVVGVWPGLPYAWFAAHWLAMSHSCYNPIVYCWMNARFRAAFAQTLAKVPLVKRCVPPPGPMEPLGRANTCTSYVSVRGNRSSCGLQSRYSSELVVLQRPTSIPPKTSFLDEHQF